MSMSLPLPNLWQHLQRQLFPVRAEERGPLSELDEQFCQCVSGLDLGPLRRRFAWIENGRPPLERTWLFHAFLAKSIYQFPTTEALIASPPVGRGLFVSMRGIGFTFTPVSPKSPHHQSQYD